MATIYNSQLSKELIDGAKISTIKDNPPNQLAEKVVPTMEVNPRLLGTIRSLPTIASLSNATTATIYVTSASMDTYLYGAMLSMIKDITATSTNINLNVTDAETNTPSSIINIRGITLTPKTSELVVMFPRPIKLKKNSNITLTSDTNVGNILASAKIYGYEDPTTLA